MNERTLQQILNFFPGPSLPGNLAAYLAAAFADIRGIQDAVRVLSAKKQAALEDFQAEIKNLNSELALIRDQCRHWTTIFQGDPSGGSDTSTVCEHCGKEL